MFATRVKVLVMSLRSVEIKSGASYICNDTEPEYSMYDAEELHCRFHGGMIANTA